MARYNVVIETREATSGAYMAVVVDGPQWMLGTLDTGRTARDAYGAARLRLRRRYPKHSLDFLHAEHGEDR